MIYLDLVLLINFIYDYILLTVLKFTIKNNVSNKKILLLSLFGCIPVIILILDINNIIKIIINIILYFYMFYLFNNVKSLKNILLSSIYFFMETIILSGFILFLNNNFKNITLSFLLIISPVILYINYKYNKYLKVNNKYNILIKIVFDNNKSLITEGFIDTGNNVIEPVTRKYVIFINRRCVSKIYNIRSPMYMSINTVSGTSLIELIKIKYIEINNIKYYNCLLGISDNIKNNCLLNYKLMEKIL